jgi:hypothetical protein
MIYDSIRQGKPAIRNNFGAGRLNTRIGFYLFEANRLSFIQNKSFYTVRFNRAYNNLHYPEKDFLLYLTSIDSTLFSYSFFNSTSNRDIIEGDKSLLGSIYNKNLASDTEESSKKKNIIKSKRFSRLKKSF